MQREQIKASPEHERNFRAVWRLRDDLANDPIWQMAYEHAAKYKLYPDEMNAIGQALVRAGDICDFCRLPDAIHDRCPECGYTWCDAQMHGDHHLCGHVTPAPPKEQMGQHE